MLPERFLSHFRIPGQVDLLSQASLLPENGHGASDLHMRDQEALRNDHYLLSLAEIGHVALVVDTPGVVSGARTVPHAPGYKRNLHIDVVDQSSCLRKVALNQRSEPANVYFLPDEITIQSQVPEILVVTRYEL